MATRNWKLQPRTVARAGLFVVLSTVALTASFLGVVGLFSGRVSGLTARLPFYVLVMAICFVVVIIGFDSVLREAQQVLGLAVAVSILALALVTLGGEGIVYLVEYTEQVVASHLLFYILAAGLIGTGLCYWAIRHWAELADTASRL
jgi:hypothetical protein